MVRRISPTQWKNKLRQAVQKQKQAINKYNQAVRTHNQKKRQAVNKYNQAVRAHNSRTRANHQRLQSELARLSRQSTSSKYVIYRTSVLSLHSAYTRLEQRADARDSDPRFNRVLDLSEREAANSVEVMNALLESDPDQRMQSDGDQNSRLRDELQKISPDLNDRWQGAVFSLSPSNPDAARHFCTSAREIITRILDIKAPDTDVIGLMPDCDRTERGTPTRRAKIKFFLHHKMMTDEAVEDFVEEDMDNIVQLFHVFNESTHGPAGKYNLNQLSAIKRRVEDGILFLSELVN